MVLRRAGTTLRVPNRPWKPPRRVVGMKVRNRSEMRLLLFLLAAAVIAPSAERKYETGTVSTITRQPHSNYEAGNKAVLYEITAQTRIIVAADVSGTAFSDYRKPKFAVGDSVQFRTHKDRCYVVYQGKEAKMWLDSEKAK
jgi:hypothetical protein